ncbi:MAG TPA: translation initiation factor IF-2 [Candidatus Saccharimonadales bacterium]
MPKTVEIPDTITVGELAAKLDIEVIQLITELVKNGVMATVNDSIDFETAEIILGELELEEEVTLARGEEEDVDDAPKRPDRDSQAEADRPPVVAVMGHVDHGKTTLLDAIRDAKEVEGEAGGITQHISAYQVDHDGRSITFLDTPGHEAFTSLRQHGAYLTDLVVLVVAADDGVKPQTLEAIKYAEKAGVKIMVAINKIDKTGANINRVMQELAENNLNPEAWGGDTVMVEVSALKKQGIDKLLEMILLVTDVEELKADSVGPAEGVVIEGHMETGRGAVVTVLVEHGQLKRGDIISAGQSFGKVRTLEDHTGELIQSAGPSTPATITGLKQLPNFGVLFKVHVSEKAAKAEADKNQLESASGQIASTGSELLAQIHKDRSSKELPVLVKADVRGSMTSVVDSLQALGRDSEVSVRIAGSGVGSIKESDIAQASAGNAIIYGFNVDMPANVKRSALQEEVPVRLYKIIYELIDNVKEELETLLEPDVVEEDIGRLIIKGVFKTTKSEIICGGEVTKGKVKPGVLVKILRDKEEIGQAVVATVQKNQTEAEEVVKGEMCGLQLATEVKVNVKEKDRLEFFTRETVKRKLST